MLFASRNFYTQLSISGIWLLTASNDNLEGYHLEKTFEASKCQKGVGAFTAFDGMKKLQKEN